MKNHQNFIPAVVHYPECKNVCLIYLSGFRFQLLDRIFSGRIIEPFSSQYFSLRRYQDLIFISLLHGSYTEDTIPHSVFLVPGYMILHLAAWQQFIWIDSLYWVIQIVLYSCLIFTAHYPPTILIFVSSVPFIWIISSSSCSISQ